MQVMDSMYDILVMNTDATSYQFKKLEKCLETAEREKKNNCLGACLKQRQHFTRFIVSVGGLLGVEAKETQELIASQLATK